jgi:hypothetical protein
VKKFLVIQLVSDGQVLFKLEYPTEISERELLERISSLLEIPTDQQPIPSDVSPKYALLARYFLQQQKDYLHVTFAQIEEVLTRQLPDSARSQRAWWANTLSHSQATAWMLPGWKMSNVDLDAEKVKFERL